MIKQMIGDVPITRIEEMCGPFFPPDVLLPDLPQGAIEAHAGWLQPDFYDPNAGCFVLSIHSWVIKTQHHTVLVDACVGNDKERETFADFAHLNLPFLQTLSEAGVHPEAVDIVLCTHLHVDHVGWNTRLQDGRWVPTFPNAKYIFAKQEHDFWAALTPEQSAAQGLDGALVYADSVLPVVEAGQSEMVEGRYAIDDQLLIEPAPGHTPGSITLKLTSNGQGALFAGDTLHHQLQVYYPDVNSGFCLDPVAARNTRRRILEECASRPQLLLPAHFAPPCAFEVSAKGDTFVLNV